VKTLGDIQKTGAAEAAEATRGLGAVAAEVTEALKRLRAIEAPPLEWDAKLANTASAFATLASHADNAGRQMRDALESSTKLTDALGQTAIKINDVNVSAHREQTRAMEQLEAGAGRFASLLTSMADTLERDRRELANMEVQARRAAEAATQVTESATLVLERLVEITRGLVDFVKSKS